MRIARSVAFRLFVIVCSSGRPDLTHAQTPAPVESVSSLPPRSATEEQKALHVPPGFEIQLVATEPDIHKPLNLAFDDRGRLWVTSTVEYPYPAPAGTRPRDTVKILSDFQPDGRARKIETFADGLNIPIGLLPLPSAREALVHNIPSIYLVRDVDGDGRADAREVVYTLFGHRDTHGMTNAFSWGFDGWIYACHGFSNDSQVEGKDHKSIHMQSGNTYRMRADGSHAEYYTHGQVNPFGLAFDPLGNLYSADCHSRPVYQLIRGAYYPSFGKPDDGLGFGPDMVTHDHGSTGIGGISFYAADQFPEAYRGTVFLGNVVTNRVNHDKIEWHGSSPKGIEQPDFVWSEDNWFRPVDIELGPDGALYIADFYNRIIGHYEVPLTHPGRDRERGRIWRIVYKGPGASSVTAPDRVDRTRSAVADLVADLVDPNLVVRLSAANQLVDRGGAVAIAAVKKIMTPESPARQRVHGLWVLERTGALDDATLVASAGDADRELRVHTMKVLVDRAQLTKPLSDLAPSRLGDADPAVRRAAAEVLGAHPSSINIQPLLALWRATSADDSHLIHVARIALRDQLKGGDVWSEIDRLKLTEPDLRDIGDVTTGVHTEGAARFLLTNLKTVQEPHANWLRFVHHIARYGVPALMPDLVALAVTEKRTPAQRLELLKAIQQGAQERGAGLDEQSRRVATSLAKQLLGSAHAGDVVLGIDVVREFGFRELQSDLKQLLNRRNLGEDARVHALSALAVIEPTANLGVVAGVLADVTAPLKMRNQAANLLGNLDRPEAEAALLSSMPSAPEQLQSAIAAALVRRREGADALLRAIAAGKASARLLQDRSVTIRLESSGVPGVNERIASLLKGLPPADQKLSALYDHRRRGFASARADSATGALVFEKHCTVCHQIGGKGARVGPQLDGIGSRGLDRLMEDVLDPNRNVDQTFRVTNLALQNGQTVSGLLLREEGEVVIVADSLGKEVRVPKSLIEERSISPLSPMPANLTDQITEPDFYRLMAFLLSRRESSDRSPATAAP
jgi:putative heme-binding domain-containing protein